MHVRVIAVFCVFVLAGTGCAYMGPPPREVAQIYSPAGYHVTPIGGSCGVPTIVTMTSVRFGALRIEKTGKVWTNPLFQYLKPGIGEFTARDASHAVLAFRDEAADICGRMELGAPEILPSMWAYYGRSLGLMAETAVRLEAVNTKEQYVIEIDRAARLVSELRADKPDWRKYLPPNPRISSG